MEAVEHQDSFQHFLIKSLVAHVALVLFFVVRLTFFPDEEIIVRDAIRVDIVGLPDKITPDTVPDEKPAPKQVAPVKEKAAEPPKAQTPKAETKKDMSKTQKKALDKLKAMEAIEKMANESKKETAAAKPKTQYKGNALNAGSSLTGLEKIQFDSYFSSLQSHVKNNWNLPPWLASQNLKAQAIVRIDERGNVIGRQVTLSSGNDVFDSRMLSAIDQSSPCPPPPARLAGVIESKGIVFNFP